jgi:hypothetical protein
LSIFIECKKPQPIPPRKPCRLLIPKLCIPDAFAETSTTVEIPKIAAQIPEPKIAAQIPEVAAQITVPEIPNVPAALSKELDRIINEIESETPRAVEENYAKQTLPNNSGLNTPEFIRSPISRESLDDTDWDDLDVDVIETMDTSENYLF